MRKYFAGTLSLFTLTVLNLHAQSGCSGFPTYFGGTQSDEIKSLVIDQNKNTYIVGNTYSSDLPVTNGLINDAYSGSYDAFLAKFDSCGSLLWSTYMGGANFDSAEKMTLGTDGNLLICGYTSSLNTFTTSGCFQSTQNGSYDAFISKVSPAGHIIWSTLFGKAGGDFAYDISVDKLNYIIVGGTTTSTDLYTTSASFQQTLKGNTDAFIARFSPGGSLRWCTYYGGNNSEDIHVVTTDNSCHVIGAGGSFSTNLNTSPGAYQSLHEGFSDGYLIKLDSSCARVFSTYFGGSGVDDVWGIACDAGENIYMAGHTNSVDFDTTAGAWQTQLKGLSDLYVSKWSPAGALMKCTLFGGSQNEQLGRMALSGPYELTLAGKTESTDVSMLGSNHQSTPGGGYDALLAKFDAQTLKPVWSSYYGGSQDEEVFDLICYHGRFMSFAGTTNSTDLPLAASPYQTTLNNSVDGFVSTLRVGLLIDTGFDESALPEGLAVFPNPFGDRLSVSGNFSGSLLLYDVYGNLAASCDHCQSLETARLPLGVYVLTLRVGESSRSFRLIR